ncbi:MAG: class I SAM-dependent methyltransferase [Candidatus Omnitrophica bacterium]|nr:class I SAM-dependent methyltransferase [Candidatus Omnitrophota bacterium]
MSRPIEAQVLQHYRTVNPSRMPVETPEAWEALVERRLRIFRDRLHLPLQLFRGAQVLDLGCGTGEHTLVYAAWGAQVTGVDFNRLALERLQTLFARRRLHATVECTSISQWQPRQSYDIAVADGVLDHVEDQRGAFRKLAASVKSGGLVVICVAPLPGAEQRVLLRRLISRFSGGEAERAVALMRKWFPEYLDRARRFGSRTELQIVADNFLTPRHQPIALADLFDWMVEAELSLYRSWPPLEPPLADQANHQPITWLLSPYRAHLIRQASAWTVQREQDAEVYRSDSPEADRSWRHARWMEESQRIEALLAAGDQTALDQYLPTCQVVGRGCCGVGEWWLVGVKP